MALILKILAKANIKAINGLAIKIINISYNGQMIRMKCVCIYLARTT